VTRVRIVGLSSACRRACRSVQIREMRPSAHSSVTLFKFHEESSPTAAAAVEKIEKIEKIDKIETAGPPTRQAPRLRLRSLVAPSRFSAMWAHTCV